MTITESHNDTIVALATPPGTGAIGILRVSGPDAIRWVSRLQKNASAPLVPRRLSFRTLIHPKSGLRLDQAGIVIMPGRASYTGEDMVELYGHGGQLNMNRLLEAICSLGARLAEPGEFTRRAFLNGRMDLAQAEAVAMVIAARSELALDNAQTLLSGGLGKRIQRLKAKLLHVTAGLEAQLDFDEDIHWTGKEGDRNALCAQALAIATEVNALLDTYRIGQYWKGFKIALLGHVNVGKSSVFNALLGKPRVLVSDEPGTTRDYIEAELLLGKSAITLIDTAGYREAAASTPLEREGRKAAEAVLEECAFSIAVVDATTSGEEGLLRDVGCALVVANKVDLVSPDCRERVETAWKRVHANVVFTSAVTGEGVETLKEALERLIHPHRGEEETLWLTERRQAELLQGVAKELASLVEALHAGVVPEIALEHARDALNGFGRLLGEDYTEAVLDEVFAQFCVGK